MVPLLERFGQVICPINLGIIIMIFSLGDNSQESSILPLLTIMCCILLSILEVFNKQDIVLKLRILLLNFHEISRIPTAFLSLRDSTWEEQLCLKANFSLPKHTASLKVNPLPWPGPHADTQGWYPSHCSIQQESFLNLKTWILALFLDSNRRKPKHKVTEALLLL